MKQQIVVLVGVLLLLLMIFPLISIFDKNQTIGGLPIQAVYIFGVWALAILALALVIANKKIKR